MKTLLTKNPGLWAGTEAVKSYRTFRPLDVEVGDEVEIIYEGTGAHVESGVVIAIREDVDGHNVADIRCAD